MPITKLGNSALNVLALYGDDIAIDGYRVYKMKQEQKKARAKAKARREALLAKTAKWTKSEAKEILTSAGKRALTLGLLSTPVALAMHRFYPSAVTRLDKVRMPAAMAVGGGISGGVISNYKVKKRRSIPIVTTKTFTKKAYGIRNHTMSVPSLSLGGLTKRANDALLFSALAGQAGLRGKPDDNPYLNDIVYARHRLAQQAVKDGMVEPKSSLLKNLAVGGAVGAAAGPLATQLLAHRLPPQFAEKLVGPGKGRIGAGLGAGLGLYAGYKHNQRKLQARDQALDYINFYAKNRKSPMPITKSAASSVDNLASSFKKSLNSSGKGLTDKEKAFRAKREAKLQTLQGQAKARSGVKLPKGLSLKGLGLGAAALGVAGAGAAYAHSRQEKTASILGRLAGMTKKTPPMVKTTKVNTKDWRVPGVPTGSTGGSTLDKAVTRFEPRSSKLII